MKLDINMSEEEINLIDKEHDNLSVGNKALSNLNIISDVASFNGICGISEHE